MGSPSYAIDTNTDPNILEGITLLVWEVNNPPDGLFAASVHYALSQDEANVYLYLQK
jgi:hypothetical protein